MQSVFRIAAASDADAIATLVNQAYRPAPQERGWTHESDLVAGARTSSGQVLDLFGPRSAVLLLCQGPAIVACVHLQDTGAGVYIGMLASAPARQAQGLGKRMLAHAERYAVERFGATLFKMSVLSSRPELSAFYERRGYVRSGGSEDYPLSAGVGKPVVDGLRLETLTKPAPAPPASDPAPVRGNA